MNIYNLCADIKDTDAGKPSAFAVQGWCPVEKATVLHDLVELGQPRTIVEIGVFGGRSVIAMAMAAKTYGGTVHAIDPWAKGPCLEGKNSPENDAWWASVDLEAVHQHYLKALEHYDVVGSVRTMRMTDEFAITEFADEQIGMLHVDGNHSEEASMRYVRSWGPKVAKGGIIVMDDINWETQKATVEYLDKNYSALAKYGTWAYYRKDR